MPADGNEQADGNWQMVGYVPFYDRNVLETHRFAGYVQTDGNVPADGNGQADGNLLADGNVLADGKCQRTGMFQRRFLIGRVILL